MMKALMFDLDDTLFLEGDFIASGYRAVAHYVSACCGANPGDVFLTMLNTLSAHGRREVLRVVKRRFSPPGLAVADLVQIYRRHEPRISVLPGYGALLLRLGRRHKLGILTDGLPEVQHRKIRALGLDRVVDGIVCTWDLGIERQKPDPAGFLRLLSLLGVPSWDALYIGDNPGKDRVGAANAGVRFVQVCHGRPNKVRAQRDEAGHCARIASLHELPKFLESFG